MLAPPPRSALTPGSPLGHLCELKDGELVGTGAAWGSGAALRRGAGGPRWTLPAEGERAEKRQVQILPQAGVAGLSFSLCLGWLQGWFRGWRGKAGLGNGEGPDRQRVPGRKGPVCPSPAGEASPSLSGRPPPSQSQQNGCVPYLRGEWRPGERAPMRPGRGEMPNHCSMSSCPDRNNHN